MFYSYKGVKPVVHPSAFVHPQATVTGNVIIGKEVYVGPGAAIRGDFGKVIIEDGCNVQENCTIHMFPGVTVHLKAGAHIGHGAIIHGAIIGRNCLVGMNAVIMDDVVVGDESIIGALAFVKAKEQIPARSVVAGNPAKIVKTVSDEMIAWKTEGTAIYQQLAREGADAILPCTPLQELEEQLQQAVHDYTIWQNVKEGHTDKRIVFFEREYLNLLQTLDVATPPEFGKMNVMQMIEHMAYAFRQGAGLIPLPPALDEATTAKMLAFLRSDKPFRDNTPNQYLPDTPPAPIHDRKEDAIADLRQAISQFFAFFKQHDDRTVLNPFFGELGFDDYLQLLFKHARHHLRQFGVKLDSL